MIKYYVGDLCYVMKDVWEEVCDLTFPDDTTEVSGELKLKDGRKFIIYGTKYGDGEYFDNFGRRYSVDSGTLGLVKLDDIWSTDTYMEGGNILEFPTEIGEKDCEYIDGLINFGNVYIDTANDSEGDEEEYEEDWDEEDA